jgi:uncharacterized membrane protein YbhN (UPF0104 family)
MADSRSLPLARPARVPRGPLPRSRPWWPWLRRGATAVFFLLVAGLLVSQARSIEWGAGAQLARGLSPHRRLGRRRAGRASFTLYSCFDLLGRRYTRHKLGTPTVMLVTFISYAFNLNLGSVVGGVAFRFRLYSRLGLKPGAITRIMSISMLANWMGYVLLAGLVFSLHPPTVPARTGPSPAGHLRLAGLALLVVAAAYLAVCAFTRRRHFELRGHTIELPAPRLACLQLLMGAGNWLIMSGILFILLQHRIEFSAVVAVLLLAAVAGVITHIPAGLGVLEAVFVALLSHLMPQAELLAALVAYRVIYYLAPLGIASAAYLLMETRARQLARAGRQAR